MFGLAALSAMILVFKLQIVSRLIVFGFCLLYIPVSLAARWLTLLLLEAHHSHIYHIQRVLVVGSKDRAKEFIRQVDKVEDACCEVIGCFEPDPSLAKGEVENVPVLGTTENLRDYLLAYPVDVVVFAIPLERIPQAKSLIDSAMELGLRVVVLGDFYIHRLGYDFMRQEISIESFLGVPAAVLSNVRQKMSYIAAKRLLDILLSATLLVPLSLLFLVIAVLIKMTSPRDPVLYRLKVVGTNRKPFVGYKFRTMVRNADELKPSLMKYNEMQGPVFKMRNDPRTTELGRFLRKYSLDELPQLYSVLKGDMSLVGPRAPLKEEADRFEFWQGRKLSVRPGITCLWQVNGRNQIATFDEWARLDLEYIKNASLWLDFKILLKTIPTVIRGRGA
jgi:exopolysaccharide biosynthesis polyprenyl glycosylphosphotransferase